MLTKQLWGIRHSVIAMTKHEMTLETLELIYEAFAWLCCVVHPVFMRRAVIMQQGPALICPRTLQPLLSKTIPFYVDLTNNKMIPFYVDLTKTIPFYVDLTKTILFYVDHLKYVVYRVFYVDLLSSNALWTRRWIPKFQRNILPPSLSLKMETVGFSKLQVHTALLQNTVTYSPPCERKISLMNDCRVCRPFLLSEVHSPRPDNVR
jgi:hypothetical protein